MPVGGERERGEKQLSQREKQQDAGGKGATGNGTRGQTDTKQHEDGGSDQQPGEEQLGGGRRIDQPGSPEKVKHGCGGEQLQQQRKGSHGREQVPERQELFMTGMEEFQKEEQTEGQTG